MVQDSSPQCIRSIQQLLRSGQGKGEQSLGFCSSSCPALSERKPIVSYKHNRIFGPWSWLIGTLLSRASHQKSRRSFNKKELYSLLSFAGSLVLILVLLLCLSFLLSYLSLSLLFLVALFLSFCLSLSSLSTFVCFCVSFSFSCSSLSSPFWFFRFLWSSLFSFS